MAIIISGKNPVIEAIKHKHRIDEIYVQEHTNKDVLSLAEQHQIPVTILSKQEINNLLDRNNQGVGAKAADYTYTSLDDVLAKSTERKTLVMLDQIQDPHNLGAILRSADAFQVDGVIIPKNRSVQLNQTVAKVSTGAIFHVDVVQVTNLNHTIKKLKENGFWVVGTDMNTNQTIHDIQVDTDLCIVVGNEGRGMSRLVRDNCDYIVKIPMGGDINSLNASVSTAITLYEIFHRRG